MLAAAVVSVAAAWVRLSVGLWAGGTEASTGAPPGGPPPTLEAAFALRTTDGGGADASSGTLAFLPGGDVCVWVAAPVRQEMRLSARALDIYYPDRDLALVAKIAPRQAPPMLEPIIVGVVDPGGTLPAGARLLEQHRGDGQLTTRWSVVDSSGHAAGELRTVETRDGAASVEIADPKGHVLRRFTFGDRARVGGRSVPREIDAQYFAADGRWLRREQWTLRDLAPIDGTRPALYDCAHHRPTTKVQELAW
jgi:hypothetical protein